MSPSTTTGPVPRFFIRRHRHVLGLVAASIVWGTVMIATGDIAWPLAMWMATALGPYSLQGTTSAQRAGAVLVLGATEAARAVDEPRQLR